MHFDDLSNFLHSPAWEVFLREIGADVARHENALFVKGVLPNKGEYWRGSRIEVSTTWQLPVFAKNSWFIRLEPLNNVSGLEKFGKVRPTDAIQPKQTLVLDLTQSEQELLAGMKSKHRYNIRVAERHEVSVTHFHEDAAAHFDRFWNLLTSTAERQTFRTHSKAYYKKMIETLALLGKAHLGFAQYQGKDVTTLLLITEEKVATYLHGGSAAEHKEVMAPFALQWQTMQWAKQHGFEKYDFWGINAVQKDDGWEPLVNHPSTGTTRFKLGFGGTVINYPGAIDLVLKPIPYTLYSAMRRIIRGRSKF